MQETETKRFHCLSDIGKGRKNNEDTAYCGENPYGTLLVVADGMGGHRKGDMASKIVVDELSLSFSSLRRKMSNRKGRKFLSKNLKRANKRIYDLSLSGTEYKEMGTTAVCALVLSDMVLIDNVGDSRCYILKRGEHIKAVTTDQTYVELLFESGRITKSEMKTHPQRNLLVNAIGINPSLSHIQEVSIPIEEMDVLLLCSDGLYNAVSDEKIEEIISSGKTAEDIAKLLIDEALSNNGTDNIAVSVYVR